MTTYAVGAAVQAARERAGLSQRAVAAMTGLSQSTLHRIEDDARTAKVDELVRIADAVGCTLSELVGTSAVRERALCAARADEGCDMGAAQQELFYYLELSDRLSSLGIPA